MASADVKADSEKDSLFGNSFNGEPIVLNGAIDEEMFDSILLTLSSHKAADIRIMPDRKIMCDIGGVNYEVTNRPITPDEVDTIIRLVYGENGVGEVTAGNDLDPDYEIKLGRDHKKRFRVNITAGRMQNGQGKNIVIRNLPSTPIDYRLLDLEPDLVAAMRPKDGLIIFTGPTGSGKSTTQSSMTRMYLENPNGNESIIEYSKPIEFVYDEIKIAPSNSIFQSEVGRDIRPRGDDYSTDDLWSYCMTNAMRRKPTIIQINEARDKATIEGVINGALTGHLVVTTAHTIGVAETISRIMLPFPEEHRQSIAMDFMTCIRVVCTQILLPKVGGGKVACREYMIFNRAIAQQFMSRPTQEWTGLIRLAMAERRTPSQTMTAGALKLLRKGLISVDTFEHVAAPSSRG